MSTDTLPTSNPTPQPIGRPSTPTGGADDVQYCTFFLGELFLGVPVTRVQEVIRDQERTRVPLVSNVVHGLINLRGEIVTTIDLRPRLALAPRPDGIVPVHVVVRHDDGVVSLLADEIGDVFDVTDEDFEALPPTVHGVARDFALGIYKVGERLLLILDVERLLDLADVVHVEPGEVAA